MFEASASICVASTRESCPRVVPSLLDLVLREPVRQSLVARKAYEFGCFGFAAVCFVHRSSQIGLCYFLEQFLQVEPASERPSQYILAATGDGRKKCFTHI